MKEKYCELCKTNKTIPLFLRNYWLDAVCNNWDVILCEKNNNVIGAFVYVIKEKMGLKYISMPPLTQYNGIWIDTENLKNEKKIKRELEVTDYFESKISQMKLSYYMQSFSPQYNNWLSFFWKGYKQQTNYTLLIKKDSSIDECWKNISSTLRNEIKKASQNAEIFINDDLELFYDMLIKTYERQNDVPRISKEQFLKFDKIINENNSRIMIGAKDDEGNIHSICYFVYDNQNFYYLLSGSDYNFRKSNFNSLIIWEGIKKAKELNLNFDFEGSMNKNINSFMRKFGGELVPYYIIDKVMTKNPIIKLLIKFKI